MRHLVHELKKEFSRHAFDYLIFFTGGVFFLLGLHIFRGERLFEFIILMAFIAFYIVWSTYHHIVEDSLHMKVVLEYVLIGFTVLFLFKIILIP